MKLLMILVLTFYGSLLLAEEQKVSADEQKVCIVAKGAKGAEKIRKTLEKYDCQKGDILYIRGPEKTLTAAHACIIETIKAQASANVCEYRGSVRDERKKGVKTFL